MSLFTLLSVSASGMAAQRTRAELLVENMANSETTRTAEGGPYKRRDVVFESAPQQSAFQSMLHDQLDAVQGVRVSQVIEDTREPDKRYQPGHPDADKEGYVSFPRFNPAEEMVDLLSATRGYEANLAAMSAVKDMIRRSLDILRS